ncbi:hypothetical protein C8N24_2813 [Solirubrobacter pauli]|uniref:Uncharacterized protein n=1 Tax=Solirubrobacter pauli TaxID=166793 RepID=A0A660LF79_9ACTN|nr:hypothetical protein C8N24_2813 [Solirubrobacter pauli]
MIGWGTVPREPARRAAFIRAHRRSVQRWLDDLESAGVVAHEPERDGDGVWWRTQILLLAAPTPSGGEIVVARARARTWKARERLRQRTARRAPTLAGIRARSATPIARTRARLARRRAAVGHETARRAAIEATIAASRDLTHPFGAPPTSAFALASAQRLQRVEASRAEGSAALRPVQTLDEPEAVAGKTGARGRVTRADAPAARTTGTEEVRHLSREAFDALVRQRLAAASEIAERRRTLIQPHVAARAEAVLSWPAGSRCPLGRLREAWVVHRHGLATAVESGSASAGPVREELSTDVQRAIALYEAHAEERPPGWPVSGAAALCALASQRRAEQFVGDLARLLVLAKGMRAVAAQRDGLRVARAQRRAAARRRAAAGPRVLQFRLAAPRFETAEGRRTRVRDAVLLAEGDPSAWPNAELALKHLAALSVHDVRLLEPDRCEELDGVGARATRYRDQLARGTWALPPSRFNRKEEPPQ